jgi:transketolase
VLAQAGFIDDDILDRFYAYESPFGMHPAIKLAGVEMSTGGLGHGLSIALGMALGARLQQQDFRTVVMIGDGELQEGSNWEAAMAAAHFGVANLAVILEPMKAKWEAFGWAVREVDGHDMDGVVSALDALPYASHSPSAIIAHTVKGKGASFAEDSHLWHSTAVTDEIYERAVAELGEPR